jgi:hypothetical protein
MKLTGTCNFKIPKTLPKQGLYIGYFHRGGAAEPTAITDMGITATEWGKLGV